MSRTIKAVRRGPAGEDGSGEVEITDSASGTWVCRIVASKGGRLSVGDQFYSPDSTMCPGPKLIHDMNEAVRKMLESE